MGSQGLLYHTDKIWCILPFETSEVKTQALQFFAGWNDRLLCEQTNELAHDDEATLGMA